MDCNYIAEISFERDVKPQQTNKQMYMYHYIYRMISGSDYFGSRM